MQVSSLDNETADCWSGFRSDSTATSIPIIVGPTYGMPRQPHSETSSSAATHTLYSRVSKRSWRCDYASDRVNPRRRGCTLPFSRLRGGPLD